MFRKFWKTFKILAVLIIILFSMPKSILPLQTFKSEVTNLDEYIELNNAETRLNEFKDDVEALKKKLVQVDIINASRKRFKAPAVKLDIFASRVANKMCREAAENDFIGHWNLAGEKPYQRYGFAGGKDHVAENAFGEWTTGSYDLSAQTVSAMMKNGHSIFMKEKAPNDGHKKTIIEKYHNYVGLGFYLSKTQFRYYEEFIDRYLDFENIPSEVNVGEPFTISVKPSGRNFLYYMIVYREKAPKPMNPAQIKRLGSYADFTDEEYMKFTAWDLSAYKSGDIYKIPLKFAKEGYYYIHIYLDDREITKPTSLNTKGRTSASGIVIISKK